jgi:hypothetical protein
MKQIRTYLSILTAVVLLLSSCSKDVTTQDKSLITNFVAFTLDGLNKDGITTIPVGSAFVDPGFKGMEGTNDVTSSVTVDGTVDGMTVGLYTLTYSAVNKDGFPSSVTRTVIIYDPAAPATDLTGSYKGNPKRQAPYTRSFVDLDVTIKKLAPGFFFCSDFLGGFYAQGKPNYNYGPSYAGWGYFILNADNTITYVSSHFDAWGDSLVGKGIDQATYNPVTKAIQWHAYYSAYTFIVDLTLVQ